MRSLKEGTVESVKLIKTITGGLDMCSIVIDFDEYIAFYPFAELSTFLQERVRYDTRPDMVEGVIRNVLTDIILVSEVQTIDKVDNIKLIPKTKDRPMCNFDIHDIRFGSYQNGCTALLVKATPGESKRAKWTDCEMLDKNSNLFSIRIFNDKIVKDADNSIGIAENVNCYVKFDLVSTKYGYQTEELYFVSDNTEPSPEVKIAKEIVQQAINEDPALVKYCSTYKFADAIDAHIDGEPGYLWVRMATELYLIQALENVADELNIISMKRAAICSNGYTLPHKDGWANNILNSVKILKIEGLNDDLELKMMLDPMFNLAPTSTKKMYLLIKDMVTNLINIRRNIDEEDRNTSDIVKLRNYLNGLL